MAEQTAWQWRSAILASPFSDLFFSANPRLKTLTRTKHTKTALDICYTSISARFRFQFWNCCCMLKSDAERRGYFWSPPTLSLPYVFRTKLSQQLCFVPFERNSFIHGYISWTLFSVEAGCVGELTDSSSERSLEFSWHEFGGDGTSGSLAESFFPW